MSGCLQRTATVQFAHTQRTGQVLESQPCLARLWIYLAPVANRRRYSDRLQDLTVYSQFISRPATVAEPRIVDARRIFAKHVHLLVAGKATGEDFARKGSRVWRQLALQDFRPALSVRVEGRGQTGFKVPVIRKV